MKYLKKAFAQQSWATGAGHAALEATMTNVTGKLTRIDVIASSVTANPTVTVTITDTDDGGTYVTTSALADGTHHILVSESDKGTQDASFNKTLMILNNLTVSIDPSADAGGAAQTLTVDVILYLE